MVDLIIKLLRSLVFFFDQLIFGFIPTVYNFIEILAKAYIFDQGDLNKFANNIYAVIGVFMLFRLAFVLLNSIIDPDKLTSKEGGAAKMMGKVIVALILIVAIPWGFKLAFVFQNTVLENQILIKIILGKNNVDKNAGQTIGSVALSAFLACDGRMEPGDYEACKSDLQTRGFDVAFPTSGGESSFEFLSGSLNDKVQITVNRETKDVFKYKYNAGLSTICGGFILFMMIMFSFDVAVRVVKLGFLQLLTPVAVVGYVDPKGSIFTEWRKMTVSTYLNLFIRLVTIYFMTYIISLIKNVADIKDFSGNSLNLDWVTGAFIQIFVIIGALMFAKQAPQMLSTLFGIKEGSMGSLKNPLKNMLGAGAIGAAAGIGMKGIGGGIGAVSGGVAASRRGGSFLAGAGQGAKTGFNNVKVKDAYKGGVTGIGKSLLGGTLGASNKAGSYAAGKVTGKEEKVGIVNAMKESMAEKASKMHHTALDNTELDRVKALEKRKTDTGSYYKSPEYGAAVQNIAAAKKKLIESESQRQLWANRYQNSPTGTYQGEDGAQHSFKDAYDLANKNYVTAQKNVEYHKGEVEKMDKLPTYESDANDRKLIEKVDSQTKASSPGSFSNIPGEAPTTNRNGETTTPSGIILPRGSGNNNNNRQ